MHKDGSGPGLGRGRKTISGADSASENNLDCPTDAERVEPREVERLCREGASLIDLRAPQAFAAGHLPDAVNVTADALIERPTRARCAVILYDQDGDLIARRCSALREAVGELEFFVLDGGLRAWIDAGLPLETQ